MPHMSPIKWLILMFMIITILMVYCSIIYNFIMTMIKKKKKSSNPWKW